MLWAEKNCLFSDTIKFKRKSKEPMNLMWFIGYFVMGTDYLTLTFIQILNHNLKSIDAHKKIIYNLKKEIMEVFPMFNINGI
ncbi:hypothetical protein ABGF25_06745 [Helcococcus ovis]|uniref:hypothetical protein n=1 Tax=Helcococcus ovis TaxID=72026 RepID=UPI0038BA5C81